MQKDPSLFHMQGAQGAKSFKQNQINGVLWLSSENYKIIIFKKF